MDATHIHSDTWLVLRKKDGRPIEIYPALEIGEALALYERLSASWTGVLLCKIELGESSPETFQKFQRMLQDNEEAYRDAWLADAQRRGLLD